MFDPTTLVGLHTIISFIAIAAGILAVLALFGLRLAPIWTQVFLVTAVVTSATGFLLPATAILPSHVIGALALVVLAAVLLARFIGPLAGVWRWVYAGGMVASLYFLCFVAIAQAFSKVPALKAAAPTLSEPPFAISQGIALVIFVVLGIAALRLSRSPGAAAA
ncbi:MAG: hypothetical protein JWO51_5367 [Rhodospirillales bacterium]|nr:hypothetical protein [Rhodospirillales bacterium]